MGENSKNKNQNNFNGSTTFNGSAQFAAGDIINNGLDTNTPKAHYDTEPIWRSPFTMAVLSWIGFIIMIAELLPISKFAKGVIDFFKGDFKLPPGAESQTYLILFMILLFLFVCVFSLRRIAKNQTRHPLLFNLAISGYGGRLTLEKIHIERCPQCGGKMKYYNKPYEWIDKVYSDGKRKREVTKRIPVLECKRNSDHWYPVDPAEDRIK